MNKRWLVLLAPLGVAVGGVAGAASLPPAPAPTPVPEGLPEGQEAVSAQECFDGYMSSCDILWAVSESGSPAEDYGATCGGRIPDGSEYVYVHIRRRSSGCTCVSPPASTGDAPTPPPEEVELAQAQFYEAMAANAIDAATVTLVGCRADYSTAPNDPTIDVVSSICLGYVGGERGNPNNPPQLWGVNTIHHTDGTVFSFVFRYPGVAEGVGDPIPGTPTPVITIPEGVPAAAPTTTAAVPEGNDPNGIIARAQQYHGVTLTQDQVDCMIGIATDQGIGLENIGDPAGEAVPDGIRIFVEIAQACGAVIS